MPCHGTNGEPRKSPISHWPDPALFITTVKPQKGACNHATVSWIKNTISEKGIDTSLFPLIVVDS